MYLIEIFIFCFVFYFFLFFFVLLFLYFFFRLRCLIGLFKQTAEDIILLKRKETWEIEYLDGDGGITKLVFS
jgi:hypothetical protein